MAHSSWLGPARSYDHAARSPNTCGVYPRLAPEDTRRHRMGAFWEGPFSPGPRGPSLPGLASDRPRVAGQRCRGVWGRGI